MGSIGILTVVLSHEIGTNRQRGRKGKAEGGRGRGRGKGGVVCFNRGCSSCEPNLGKIKNKKKTEKKL